MKRQGRGFVSTIHNRNPKTYSDAENRHVMGIVDHKPNRAERRALAAFYKEENKQQMITSYFKDQTKDQTK